MNDQVPGLSRDNRIRLMSLANLNSSWVRGMTIAFAGFAVLVIAIMITLLARLPAIESGTSTGRKADGRHWTPPAEASLDWNVFESRAGIESPQGGVLAKRFRLAGTFFAYNAEADDMRRAILDDLSQDSQHIVREGDAIERVQVVRIFKDRIVLREGAHQEQLWLSFSRQGETEPAVSGENGSGVDPLHGSAAEDRFGITQVGKARWVLKRDRLMEYYQELMDEPERLVQVFDSLKPLYDAKSKITGYQLGIEGEAEFFDAVGFNEGDIVRSVNSIPMTSRRHAEYFIKEFVNDRSNAFVLRLEREGVEQKLIYQVR